ncbi:MAG: DUF3054 domain-containing protein [Dehalococcoidia bacterium]
MIDSRSLVLLLGDVAVLVLFAVIGRRTHDEAIGLAAVGDVLTTAAPFVLAWVPLAVLLGALRASNTASVTAMVARTAVAWVCALPVAILLRSLILGRPSALVFYAVAAGTGLLMLLCWRTLFVLVERRRTFVAPS